MASLQPVDNQTMSVLDSPAYPVAEAARLIDLASSRVRRWLYGYQFSYEAKTEPHHRWSRMGPVVEKIGSRGVTYASFLDLIDLLLVREFLKLGISLQTIRRAFDEVRAIQGVGHVASETFFTLGRGIILAFGEINGAMLELDTGGQLAIPRIVAELGQQVEFDPATKIAIRWYPMHPEKLIVIDPRISFGHPTIADRRITTSAVYDLFHAEEEEIDPVCDWMGIIPDEADAAIRFEARLAA